jgi:hypothetical protein
LLRFFRHDAGLGTGLGPIELRRAAQRLRRRLQRPRDQSAPLSGLRQPLLDSIVPGHSDRLPPWRPERLQQRIQFLQQRLRRLGGNSKRCRNPKPDGLLKPVL